MKKSEVFLEVIVLLFILLFVYAAVTKLIDHENFSIQIAQSPFLTSISVFVVWFIPLVELTIALLLIIPGFRLLALYASLGLMTLFTAYIIAILYSGSKIPCSCGGVLENLGWSEHLIFNSSFLLLALVGTLLYEHSQSTKFDKRQYSKRFIRIMAMLVLPGFVIGFLWTITENEALDHKTFIRKFTDKSVEQLSILDMGLNSYYLAGSDSHQIYLANFSAPHHLVTAKSSLTDTQHVEIVIPDQKIPDFESPNIKIVSPYFYITDGYLPALFKGSINNWRAHSLHFHDTYFDQAQPLGRESVIIRTLVDNESELGKITSAPPNLIIHHNLLKKQIDGIFCTDGMLLFNQQLQSIVYIYYYRNQYLVMDTSLNLLVTGRTIDPVSEAKIRFRRIESKNQTALIHSLHVNKKSSTYGSRLYINSGLLAKNESKHRFMKSSVIDVYDMILGIYLYSFYIPYYNSKELREFHVRNKETVLVRYDRSLVLFSLPTDDITTSIKEIIPVKSGMSAEHL